MEQPMLATIQPGYNMEINDKINILELKMSLLQEKIDEHNRVLNEEIHLLSEGDEEVLKNVLLDLNRSMDALNNAREVLTNQG
jgi:hypothetical protein